MSRKASDEVGRRAVVVGALGGVAALAADTVLRPTPTRAADGNPVLLGSTNSAQHGTSISNVSGTDTNVTLAGPGYGIASNSHVASGEGVVGYATGNSGRGVVGQTSGHSSQVAVDGEATTGNGEGIAVRGRTKNGVALYGEVLGGGYALQVKGRAVFSRSGKTNINAGQSSKTIPGHSISAATVVVATVQGNPSGVWVKSVSVNVSASTFTIRLNKAAPSGVVTVGYFIVN